MSAFNTHGRLTGLVAGIVLGVAPAFAADDTKASTGTTRTPLEIDFIDAAYLPGTGKVIVTGHHGVVGLLEVGVDGASLAVIEERIPEDFTALARLNETEVLIGSASGRVYHSDGTSIREIAALSEYDEPVLDIAVSSDAVWVVGARGLIARSTDGGKEFEVLEIRDVTQPLVTFPGAHPADWYLGVSNLDTDTVEFTATVNGEPAKEEEDYILFPDEGFVQIQNQLDESPAPTIQFKFNPGPPFRAGDVSWNAVLAETGKVTIAGEFGMILQSEDGGETWIRRDTEIVPREPEPAYWLAGAQLGDTLWLTGAAGVSQLSLDGGITWEDNPKPGREGIFGITLLPDGTPVIAGAVGLIGSLQDGDWNLADRTKLKLLSWLRTPVALPDGSLLVTGGRATAIRYDGGNFTRVPVRF